MENHIAKTIEKYRKNNNWSRQYLADRLGVNVSMISFYERGIKIPSDKKKLVLCELFKISWNELVGELPEITLKKEITDLLYKKNLHKDELDSILDNITNFYCKNGSYDNLKRFTSVLPIDIEKAKTTISEIECLLYQFFKDEIRKKKNKKAIPMMEISEYIQQNFSVTLNKIIESINEREILHDYFINIYEEIKQSNTNIYNKEFLANVNIIGHIPYPKEYLDKHIELFALLITGQGYHSRYNINDVVIFKKQNDIKKSSEDFLVSINGALHIVCIDETYKKDNTLLLHKPNEEYWEYFDNIRKKDTNFKILGIPIEIKINYLNRTFN